MADVSIGNTTLTPTTTTSPLLGQSDILNIYNQQLQSLQSYAQKMYTAYLTSKGQEQSDNQQAYQATQNQLNYLTQNKDNLISGISSLGWGPEKTQLISKALSGDTISQQALNEAITQNRQLQTQQGQLSDFQKQLQTQEFGSTSNNLADALSNPNGTIGQLNQFLGNQEATTFNTQLKPLIQESLGAQGLSDSGAQVELQSRALSQLEQARQANVMQAALGEQSQIQGLQYSNLLGGIAGAQANQTSTFNLQRAGITMQFQQQLEQQREQLAQQLAQQRGGGTGGLIGTLGGAAGGSIIGSLIPGLGIGGGAQLGSLLGGSIGSTVGGGNASTLQSGLGSFFANS